MKFRQYVSLILAIALLCSLLMVSPLWTVSAADNLAANGDLEMGNTNGWEIANAQIDSSIKYAGNYSLKLTATSAYSGAAYKIVPVGKGATVTVSFYYRYASTPGNAYHVYTYQGENANVGPYSNADKSLTIPGGCDSISTWKQVSYTFNSGNYAKIYLKFCPGGSGSSACYIDNLVVTATGGTQEKVDPYLTSFGTKYNRPSNDSYNLIQNGSFESTANASWNTTGFIKGDVAVVTDPTAPEGEKSLHFAVADQAVRSSFSVAVEPYAQYTFSAWVKSPRLSADNRATATFGVANAETGAFLVYEPYNGNGNGSAALSTPQMQLMTTAPDDAWHLRSVTFYSGTSSKVDIVVTGTSSRLYLDDIALYKSAYGVEYISPLRSAKLSAATNNGNKYCADENSLIPYPHMTGKAAETYWSSNPAWRNGFLSFDDVGDDHGTALKYTASAKPLQLAYIDWIDVEPNTDYVLTMDVKRLTAGNGRIMLLDDNILSPAEFYTLSFSSTDSEWKTYSIRFNSGVYSRVGFGIVDGGGSVYMDKIRLFKSSHAISSEPADSLMPATYPTGGKTAAMEMSSYVPPRLVSNGDFETGTADGWDIYQETVVTEDAKNSGGYGAHLQGDGSWGAMLEQCGIPVTVGKTYRVTFWYKANSNGTNWTITGEQSGTIYAGEWITSTGWTLVQADWVCGEDTSVRLNFCGGGNNISEDLYVDDISITDPNGGPTLGVAFRMEVPMLGAAMSESYVGYLDNATVDVYGDGTQYSIKRIGCVATNNAQIGQNRATLTLDILDKEPDTVIDIPAKYLCEVTDTYAAFAIRVINIPFKCRDTFIYARPYYVFEKDGEEVVVYGDVYSRSYNNANGSDSFALS